VPDDQRYERRRSQGNDAKSFSQGVHDGSLAQGSMEDWVVVIKFLFRVVTLPVWLPYRVWKIIRRRRQMAEFVAIRRRYVIIGDRAVREITLEWVQDHPADFILGEYDPRVPKLQHKIGKLLARRKSFS
jgi:hypothetical protein